MKVHNMTQQEKVVYMQTEAVPRVGRERNGNLPHLGHHHAQVFDQLGGGVIADRI